MDEYGPHITLLTLHRLVDEGIRRMLEPLGLSVLTEAVVTVDRGDLAELCGDEAPQSAVVALEGAGRALAVLEPALGRRVLREIWGEEPNGPGYTPVEAGILQQFLGEVCESWNASWSEAGLECLPTVEMAASLQTTSAQVSDGPWYAVRSVVEDGAATVGVILFCYPAAAIPALEKARTSITWSSRVARGLNDRDRALLAERIGEVGHLSIPAPVTTRLMLPIAAIDQLERGDVIAFDTGAAGEMRISLFDREVGARLARHGDHLAVVVDEQAPEVAPAMDFSDEPMFPAGVDQ